MTISKDNRGALHVHGQYKGIFAFQYQIKCVACLNQDRHIGNRQFLVLLSRGLWDVENPSKKKVWWDEVFCTSFFLNLCHNFIGFTPSPPLPFSYIFRIRQITHVLLMPLKYNLIFEKSLVRKRVMVNVFKSDIGLKSKWWIDEWP